MRRLQRLLVGIGLIGVLALAIWYLTPTDESRIKARLNQLAVAASFDPSESGLVRLAYGNRLRDFFDDDVEASIELDRHGSQSLHSRAEIVQFASLARSELKKARFQFLDIVLRLDLQPNTAGASMSLVGEIDGEQNAVVQELKMTLKKRYQTWFITRIESVPILR